MTRDELALLSQAHAVALTAIAAPETGFVPLPAARVLWLQVDGGTADAEFRRAVAEFVLELPKNRHRLDTVRFIGAALRLAVCRAMAYQPPDLHRSDLHG